MALPHCSSLPNAAVLEKPLEKKSGRNYGPPGSKQLIYFIDDMNMPEVDKYGTVAPHTLIRQHMDHGHWWVSGQWPLPWGLGDCLAIPCHADTSPSCAVPVLPPSHTAAELSHLFPRSLLIPGAAGKALAEEWEISQSHPKQTATPRQGSRCLAMHCAVQKAPLGRGKR